MKFKLEKNNNFKSFKVKPLVLTMVMVGGIMSSTLVGCSSNESNKSLDRNPNVVVTSVNSYKLNLKDFDKIVVPSFSSDAKETVHGIESCTFEDGGYNAKLLDGDNIISSFDNTLLIDTDFERRQAGDLDNGLGAFDGALINYYDQIKDVKINSVSLEKIGDENLFLFDTGDVSNIGDKIITEEELRITEGVRVLQAIDNAIPYRELDANTALSKYPNSHDYMAVYIEIGGRIVGRYKFIGSVDTKINECDFKLVCFKRNDNTYCEYLTTNDHLMIARDISKEEAPIKGSRLEYENATGNLSMNYKDDVLFYRRVESLVLGEDNLYYLTTKNRNEAGNILMTFPVEYYSFEFRDQNKLAPNGSETLDISDYTTLFYDENSFSAPIIGKNTTLAKINENYLYLVNEPKSLDKKFADNSNTALPNPTAGVYEVHSMAVGKHITLDELNNNYTMALEPIDFSFYLGSKVFSNNLESNGKYIAFKELDMLGLKYYSIIHQYSDSNNQTKYLEILVPKTCAAIKGEQQDISRQKVYK
ncbi:MAG: hypothetical protein PHW32_04920 [Bacilli bacterium]|nr:hypothetical protein [Bacilli bacterium]